MVLCSFILSRFVHGDELELLGFLMVGFWKGWLFLCIWIWIFEVYLMRCGFLFGFVGCSAWLVVWMGVSGGDWVCGS